MNRLAVIATTIAATLSMAGAASYWWAESHFDAIPGEEGVLILKRTGSLPNIVQTQDGLLVLTEKQAVECGSGGGCAIYSKREMQAFMVEVIKHVRQPDPGT